jgi:hypothetical protein
MPSTVVFSWLIAIVNTEAMRKFFIAFVVKYAFLPSMLILTSYCLASANLDKKKELGACF